MLQCAFFAYMYENILYTILRHIQKNICRFSRINAESSELLFF
jgi:hypothetical protein